VFHRLSDFLFQSIRLDAGLKTITTSIQKFGEVIVESKPCELTFARKKDKQAQLMVADISPPISVDNKQLNLKQKINIKKRSIRGCSLLSLFAVRPNMFVGLMHTL
jgi:hypothetical protein